MSAPEALLNGTAAHTGRMVCAVMAPAVLAASIALLLAAASHAQEPETVLEPSDGSDAKTLSIEAGRVSGCGEEQTLRSALARVAPSLDPEPIWAPELDSSKILKCFEGAPLAEAVREMLEPHGFALLVGEGGQIERLILVRSHNPVLPGSPPPDRRARARRRTPENSDKGCTDPSAPGCGPKRETGGGAARTANSRIESIGRQAAAYSGTDTTASSSAFDDQSDDGEQSSSKAGPLVSVGGSQSTSSSRTGRPSTRNGSTSGTTPEDGPTTVPDAATPVRIEFSGAISSLEPSGTTRPGNQFAVSDSDKYSGFVEIDLDVFTNQVSSNPLATNADGNATAVQIGPEQDPSIKFGLSLGGQQRFTEQDLDASFNEPLITLGVKSTIERTDPDGSGPERPFDSVSYGDTDGFFLEGVTLLSDSIKIGNTEYSLVFLTKPSVSCVTRRGTANQDCFVSGGVSGEVVDNTIGRTEVGLEVLNQSSSAAIRPSTATQDATNVGTPSP